jgi:hypothetical protein
MINPFKEINWKPGAKDLSKFAWSLIIGFPCIALVFFLAKWIKTHTLPEPRFFLMLGGIGAVVGLVCLLVPIAARPLYFIWYAATACIGLVMANLLFTVMFYGLFTPLGLFMRLLGRDPLKLRWQKEDAGTYWQDAEPSRPAAQYFSQY